MHISPHPTRPTCRPLHAVAWCARCSAGSLRGGRKHSWASGASAQLMPRRTRLPPAPRVPRDAGAPCLGRCSATGVGSGGGGWGGSGCGGGMRRVGSGQRPAWRGHGRPASSKGSARGTPWPWSGGRTLSCRTSRRPRRRCTYQGSPWGHGAPGLRGRGTRPPPSPPPLPREGS
jgi:hypothetical protein